MKYLLLLALLTNSAFGYNLTFIKKDAPAPFQGYLIDEQMEKSFRYMDQEFTYQTQLVKSLDEINKSYSDQVTIMQSRITNQTKQIQELQEGNGFFSKYGMFLLGCLTTTAIAYTINKATK